VLQVCCRVLQCVVMHDYCKMKLPKHVLQVCCSLMQCFTVLSIKRTCSIFGCRCVAGMLLCVASVLQCVAGCCRVLQCVVMHDYGKMNLPKHVLHVCCSLTQCFTVLSIKRTCSIFGCRCVAGVLLCVAGVVQMCCSVLQHIVTHE